MKFALPILTFAIFSGYLAYTLSGFGVPDKLAGRVGLLAFVGWSCIFHISMMILHGRDDEKVDNGNGNKRKEKA
jgi:hypothetical protein